jgi:hypothetical protein
LQKCRCNPFQPTSQRLPTVLFCNITKEAAAVATRVPVVVLGPAEFPVKNRLNIDGCENTPRRQVFAHPRAAALEVAEVVAALPFCLLAMPPEYGQ